MDINYDEYEKECEEIRKTNNELLELFATDLKDLAPKTVRNHISNVDFYINDFLLHQDALTFDEGLGELDDFPGDFFIRRCVWSTPATIKSTAASIKKFYKCMLDHGKIKKKGYDFLCEEIRTGMPQWQADCAQFNNIDEDNPFDFF